MAAELKIRRAMVVPVRALAARLTRITAEHRRVAELARVLAAEPVAAPGAMKLKDELFKERVGATSVKQLTRNAKERRPGSMGFAEAMSDDGALTEAVEAGRVDRIAKGRVRIGEESPDAWLQLERLLLAMADKGAARLLAS